MGSIHAASICTVSPKAHFYNLHQTLMASRGIILVRLQATEAGGTLLTVMSRARVVITTSNTALLYKALVDGPSI